MAEVSPCWALWYAVLCSSNTERCGKHQKNLFVIESGVTENFNVSLHN